jgi:hypothetical protein
MTDNLLPTIVGGALAIAGGIAGTVLAPLLAVRTERRAVAAALAGEIGALIDIAERRKYVAAFEAAIAANHSTGSPVGVSVSARRNYFAVFDALVSKLGLLPPDVARDTAGFYVSAKSLLEDSDDLREGLATPQEIPLRMQQTLELLVATLALGHRLVGRLAAVAADSGLFAAT